MTDEPPIEAPENGWSDFNPDDGAAFAAPLVVELDGYEGPLDVLLALARTQKVDIAKISILALAEQFLDFIAEARRLRLEVAADYLVMAAWLAYPQSKLLLPDLADAPEPRLIDDLIGARVATHRRTLAELDNIASHSDAGSAFVCGYGVAIHEAALKYLEDQRHKIVGERLRVAPEAS